MISSMTPTNTTGTSVWLLKGKSKICSSLCPLTSPTGAPSLTCVVEPAQIKKSSWAQHGAQLGSVGPRWAPRWPHKPWYQGRLPLLLAPITGRTLETARRHREQSKHEDISKKWWKSTRWTREDAAVILNLYFETQIYQGYPAHFL